MERVADATFPDAPGVYVLYAAPTDTRPLYVGVAARQSLERRWRRNHLGARSGSSALRRSVALHRGLVTQKLRRPARTYPRPIEEEITAYLRSCWIVLHPMSSAAEALSLESRLIREVAPTLNVTRPRGRSQLEDVLGSISIFLQGYPQLGDPARAASQCRIATDDLIVHLSDARCEATMIWARRPRLPLNTAHPRALQADAHALVRLAAGLFIDVTRRQFDPAAEVPQIYLSDEQLGAHWEQINHDPDRRAPWRALPPATN